MANNTVAQGTNDPIAQKMVNELLKVCRELLNVMEIQEKRMTEEFHIPAHTFTPIWNKAKEDGYFLLSQIE